MSIPVTRAADPFPQGNGFDGTLQRISLVRDQRRRVQARDHARGAAAVARAAERFRSEGEDAEDIGFAVRVILDGAWGSPRGVVLGTAVGDRCGRGGGAHRTGRLRDDLASRSSSRRSRCTTTSTWVSAYEIDPLSVPLAEKVALLADWSARLLAGRRASTTAAWCSVRSWRTSSTPTSAAPRRPSNGSGSSRRSRRTAPTRSRASSTRCGRIAAARRARLGVPRRRLRLGRRARRAARPARARSCWRPSVEAGRYDLVIHPSNLWLTIHESIGHATELDRALGYEANYAGTSFATLDKLGSLQYGSPVMHVTGDRTVEHGLSTIGYDDEGVADPAVGHRQGRRARRLPARPSDGRDDPRAQRRPLQRLRLRRLPRPHPDPADGERVAAAGCRRTEHRGADRRRRARHLCRRRQVLVDRHAALQLPVHRRSASTAIENGALAGQLRDVAYQATTTDFWGSMEAVGGPETWVLGGALNCGKAQPGQVASVSHGCPTSLFRDINVLNTTAGGGLMTLTTPQELVEHALDASHVRRLRRDRARLDEREPSLGEQHPHHQRRDARHLRHRDRDARHRHGYGVGLGHLDRVHDRAGGPDRRGRRRRRASRLGRRGRRRAARGRRRRRLGTSRRARPSIEVYEDFAPALGEAFGRADGRGPDPLRLRRPRGHHDVPRHQRPGSGCATCSRAGTTAAPASPTDLSASAWVGGQTRDFTDVDVAAMDAELARRLALGRAQGRPAGRPLRHDPAADRGRPTCMIYSYWRSSALDAHDGQSVFSRRGGGTRIGERLSDRPLQIYSDPAEARLATRPFVAGGGERRAGQRLRQRPPPRTHRLDPRRRARRAAADPAVGRADRAAADAVRRQPGGLASTAPPAARRTWSPASSAACC